MSTVDVPAKPYAQPAPKPAGEQVSSTAAWGNSAPLGLAAFLKDIPPLQAGHALGLFLYSFGIFTVWIWLASFRSNVVVVVALAGLAATLFVLGAGNYSGNGLVVEAGGYMGLVVAALAAYLSCAELCEAAYKRSVLPLFPLAKH